MATGNYIVLKNGNAWNDGTISLFLCATDAIRKAEELAKLNPYDQFKVCKVLAELAGVVQVEKRLTWTPAAGDTINVIDTEFLSPAAVDKVKAGETATVISFDASGLLQIRFEDGMDQWINPDRVCLAQENVEEKEWPNCLSD